MEFQNNEVFLEQLYSNKKIESFDLAQYAVKLGINCQELKSFIISEQYYNRLIMLNIYNKIIKYKLFSCYEVEQFYRIISSKDELEFLVSSINYEHPNLKTETMKFIFYLDGVEKEQFDEIELYTDEITDKLNFYNVDIINTIVELAHKTGISTKKLSNMLNKNYEEIFNIIKKFSNSRLNSNNYIQELMQLLNGTSDLLYKISSLKYNYPNFCQNNLRFISAILNCDTNDLMKVDNKDIENELLNGFIFTKREKYNY